MKKKMDEKKTLFQKMYGVVKQITVEPAGFALLLGSLLAKTATQTLSIQKACRVNLNFDGAICDAVQNQDNENNAENVRIVYEYVGQFRTYKSILTSVLPCILLIFAGGWMDITGRRKIIMLLSVTGEILVQLNNIFNVVLFYQLSVEYLIFSEGFLGSIFGGWPLMSLAIFSYIADITTIENRTYRLGLANFAVFIAMPIGMSLSGLLLKNFGYLTVYITSLIIAALNFRYIILILSDPERTMEHKSHDNRGFVYFLKTFFSPCHFLSSVKVVAKKTSDNRTLRLCLQILATCFLFAPMYGEGAVLYLSTRFRFASDELQFSTFQAYNTVVTVIGILTCVLIVSKWLGWHDAVIGILACSSKIASSFIYAFATMGSLFYLGSVVDIFNVNAVMAMRSIFSKSVEPDEIAKLNSIVGIFEVITPLAVMPLYTQIYTATLKVLPEFIFLLRAMLTIPTLGVFTWLLVRHLKALKREKISNSSNL